MADRMLAARARGGENRFRSRGLGTAVAGLAASGAATPASATVIFDLNVNETTGSSFSLTGDAASVLELFSFTNMSGFDLGLEGPNNMGSGSTVELSFFNVGMGMGNPDFLTLHAAGETVDGSLQYSDQVFLVENDGVNPSWSAGTTGYAGFTFDLGTGPLYGWLQVRFEPNGTDVTVLQWAYEDSGASIPVASIAEPSLAILVGLGVAGLLARGTRPAARADD